MAGSAWIKKRCEASVDQGLGEWMQQSTDPVLGAAVFHWLGEPAVQVFEDGFTYAGDEVLKLRYDQIVGVDLLDLPALLKAQRTPRESVEFAVSTSDGRHILRVPLYWYSTLSGLLLKAMPKGG